MSHHCSEGIFKFSAAAAENFFTLCKFDWILPWSYARDLTPTDTLGLEPEFNYPPPNTYSGRTFGNTGKRWSSHSLSIGVNVSQSKTHQKKLFLLASVAWFFGLQRQKSLFWYLIPDINENLIKDFRSESMLTYFHLRPKMLKVVLSFSNSAVSCFLSCLRWRCLGRIGGDARLRTGRHFPGMRSTLG